MKIGVKLFGGILFLLACSIPAFGGVIVNEIMYHPASTNVLEEWLELYNTGPTNVNLSGWQITKGVAFTFPTNTVLATGGYIVVAADGPTFTSRNPVVANFVAGWSGSLGHLLELSDDAGRVVNSIEFYHEGDWALRALGPVQFAHRGWEWFAEHDGLGKSLELINPILPNAYAHNWGSSTVTGGTPGRANSIASTCVR